MCADFLCYYIGADTDEKEDVMESLFHDERVKKLLTELSERKNVMSTTN